MSLFTRLGRNLSQLQVGLRRHQLVVLPLLPESNGNMRSDPSRRLDPAGVAAALPSVDDFSHFQHLPGQLQVPHLLILTVLEEGHGTVSPRHAFRLKASVRSVPCQQWAPLHRAPPLQPPSLRRPNLHCLQRGGVVTMAPS